MKIDFKENEDIDVCTANILKQLITPNTVFLDAGCGRCSFEDFLIQNNVDFKKVVCVDIDMSQLSVAKEKYRTDERFKFVLQDFTTLDMSRYPEVDTVCIIEALSDPYTSYIEIVKTFGLFLTDPNHKLFIIPVGINDAVNQNTENFYLYQPQAPIFSNWVMTFIDSFSCKAYRKSTILELSNFTAPKEFIELLKKENKQDLFTFNFKGNTSSFDNYFR